MIILVEVKNDLLGDSVFWKGDAKDVDQIRNIPAQTMARNVACDGQARRQGMWRVSEYKEELAI